MRELLFMPSVLAMLKTDGNPDKVTGSMGKVPAIILNVAIILCIGPMLAIPRTAATSFEMGAAALGGINVPWALPVFSVACVVSAALLCVVYGGLAYLGSTTGQLWSTQFLHRTLNQVGLLSNIAKVVLGKSGAVFLVVALFVRRGKTAPSLACMFGAAVAFISSLLDVFGVGFSDYFPLASFGFGWVVPTLVAALVGFAIERYRKK